MTIELNIQGSPRVAIEGLSQQVVRVLEEGPAAVAERAKDAFVDQASRMVRRQSGDLFRSFAARGEGGGLSITTDSPHALKTNEGGVIRAPGGGFMAISGGGRFALVKQVRLSPSPFIDAAQTRVDELADQELGDALEKGTP